MGGAGGGEGDLALGGVEALDSGGELRLAGELLGGELLVDEGVLEPVLKAPE